ncbi:MAG TPA: helix-hairpin-helix domain-containing protein [Blastocatellia bacterium]|nr:helix-hairpin-helix domain-containing protein [Blastocatellia bacterium]
MTGARDITNKPQSRKLTGGAGRLVLLKQALTLGWLIIVFVAGVANFSGAAQVDKASGEEKADWGALLPEGEGKAEVVISCSGCHDLRLVLTQKKTRTAWRTSIQKMVTEYKAPVDKEAFPILVSYLAEHFGDGNPIDKLPMNVNQASAEALARLPGITKEIATAIIECRASNGPFAAVDDLLRVKKLDAAALKKIRGFITTAE